MTNTYVVRAPAFVQRGGDAFTEATAAYITFTWSQYDPFVVGADIATFAGARMIFSAGRVPCGWALATTEPVSRAKWDIGVEQFARRYAEPEVLGDVLVTVDHCARTQYGEYARQTYTVIQLRSPSGAIALWVPDDVVSRLVRAIHVSWDQGAVDAQVDECARRLADLT